MKLYLQDYMKGFWLDAVRPRAGSGYQEKGGF